MPRVEGRRTASRSASATPSSIGAVGLGRHRRACCCSRSTSTSCRCSAAADLLGRAVARPAASSPATTCASPGSRSARSPAVDLDGDHVRVDFTVDRVDRPRRPRPSPRCASRRSSGRSTSRSTRPARPTWTSEIPLSRTTPAYDVVEAFSDLTTTTERDRHRPAGRARSTPSPTRSGLARRRCGPPSTGSAGSPAPSPRATTQLRELLDHANGVTGVAGRPQRASSSALLPTATCCCRSCASAARTSTRCWSTPSTLAAAAHRAGARQPRGRSGRRWPTSRTCSPSCEANQDNLDRSISCSRRSSGSSPTRIGNGRWFDTYIQNLVPGARRRSGARR